MMPRFFAPASEIPLADVDVPDTLNIKAAKFIILYATIMSTGCQLKTRFESPSDHDTPPPPIDSLLTHKLTSIIATGERRRLVVAETDCKFCKNPDDLLLSPVLSEAIDGCAA
mmetsp:Transcript_14938/g.24387  ORF Transcript_14938/g.24387 Transcript_14938/m.24387 type:complete len:113 (-) Transcript_14938:100-438(-)